jgi:hypothetical protein
VEGVESASRSTKLENLTSHRSLADRDHELPVSARVKMTPLLEIPLLTYPTSGARFGLRSIGYVPTTSAFQFRVFMTIRAFKVTLRRIIVLHIIGRLNSENP